MEYNGKEEEKYQSPKIPYRANANYRKNRKLILSFVTFEIARHVRSFIRTLALAQSCTVPNVAWFYLFISTEPAGAIGECDLEAVSESSQVLMYENLIRIEEVTELKRIFADSSN